MLRQDSASTNSDLINGSNGYHHGSVDATYSPGEPPQAGSQVGSIDIQRELNRLEELILDGRHIPLSRFTLVDEDNLLDQLDLIRLNLPAAFHEAEEIVRHKEDIFLQAEQYAQEIIAAAERRAAQLLDEMGIIRKAEMEARQIMQRVQQDCEAAREQMVAELERMEQQAQQEAQEIRRQAIAESEQIQAGADEYADGVLTDIEQRLVDMLRVIRNGRSQLQPDHPTPRSPNSTGSPTQQHQPTSAPTKGAPSPTKS